MNPVLWFSGYAVLSADAENAAGLLNLFLRNDLPFSDLSVDGDGNIILFCSLRCAKRILRAAEHTHVTLVRRGGLPLLLLRLSRRTGLIVGGLCALALLLVSRLFVWDVRVTGNRTLSAQEVIDELSACGFGVGSYLPGIQSGELENRVLLASERLSWISVHMNGTVAEVQVLERSAPPEEEPSRRPADLVAAADGQIETVELYRGNCLVRTGQAVRRGEVLVSGIFENENIGCRFTRAAGRVLARTEHTYHIEIPLNYLQKEYIGTEKGDLWLNFFGFSAKISENTGNGEGSCDIIETVTHLDRWGLPNLPLSFRRETRRLWRETEAERTPEEALELAYARLTEELAGLSDGAQLLSKRVETTLTESALILDCTVLCIENIAVQVEFDVTD